MAGVVSDDPDDARDRQPARLIACAIWFVLAVSASEIALRTYLVLSHRRILGWQFLWSVPAGYVLAFAAIGGVVALLARVRPGRHWPAALVWLLTFITIDGWLGLLIRGLHGGAAALLAAGVAAQAARLVAAHPRPFDALIRRTRLPLFIVVALLAAGSAIQPRWHEYRMTAGLPPAPRTPNVLLIVLDTVRAKSMSLYGYERATTPHLDAFAAGGVVFDRALSTSPWTLPSHGAMFTGHLPHELSAAWLTPLDDTFPTLAERFDQIGYATAGFAANTTYCPQEFGLGRGFAHYEDHRNSLQRVLMGVPARETVWKALGVREPVNPDHKFGLKTAEEINANFLAWLAGKPADRPFFAFLNYYDSHGPYLSPPEFATKFSPKRPRGDIWSRKLDQWGPAEISELHDAYDGTVSYLDAQVGALIAELEARGGLKDTIVVVTSDHGEQFGEHGLLEHANSLYLPLLNVPLIIVAPTQVPAGRRVSAFVSLRDLPATLLGLSGAAGPSGFPGASLAQYWEAAGGPDPQPLLSEVDQAYDAYPDSYPARKGPMKSVVYRDIHYIKNLGSGAEELYDLTTDPDERDNLAGTQVQRLDEFRAYLQRLLQTGGTPPR